MKFTSLALTILSAAGVIAAPLEADRRAPIYTLRVSSRSRTLDGKYLAINGTTVGIFKTPSTAVRFTPYTDPSTGLAELRSTSSSSGEALALLGSNGLLDLASVPDPASITVPRGTVLDWRSFRLAGSTDEDEGEVAGALAYAAGGNKVGGWVAFPSGNAGGEWSVKWKDEEAVTIQNYQQIKVVYERVRRAN